MTCPEWLHYLTSGAYVPVFTLIAGFVLGYMYGLSYTEKGNNP